MEPAYIPGDHERLVANPFLALAGLLLVLVVADHLNARVEPGYRVLVGFGLLAAFVRLAPRLLHVHCLDCGATGRLSAWGEHACDAVLERRRAGARRLIRGPSPPIQVILWFYLILALVIAWNAFGATWPGGPRGADLSPIFLLD